MIMKHLRQFADNLRRIEFIEVFHQDSPGERVWVRRNWIQRLYCPKIFSAIGEHHWPQDLAFAAATLIPNTILRSVFPLDPVCEPNL